MATTYKVGKIGESLLKNNTDLLNKSIYLCFHNLNVLADMYNTSLNECLELAYNEIKDRDGETINGTFIKSSDLKK